MNILNDWTSSSAYDSVIFHSILLIVLQGKGPKK